MNSLTDRIEMINSFELIKRERDDNVNMHIQSNFFILMCCGIASSITLIIVLSSVFSEVFNVETRFNWSKIGLVVLLSINFCNAFARALYKRIILKHLKFLETSVSRVFGQQLNDDLWILVSKLHKPLKLNFFVGILMFVILIGCIINFFLDSQFIYYKLFIFPTLLFYILTAFEILKIRKKIRINLREVENIKFN
ncbi:MAG: hypothetical protein EOO87_05610 [Pedobacter sp.]|nr:MAG: hypothetical protein EOO87_05610 [Pedobacter sp.]